MKRALLPLIILLISGCLQVEDAVCIHPEGSATWNVVATIPALWASVVDWESAPVVEGLLVDTRWDIDSMDNRILHAGLELSGPEVMVALDSQAWLGPLHQQMHWAPDGKGFWDFSRHVEIKRDYPGEDGGFADRMQASIYRGLSWSFRLSMPGLIEEASPQPIHVDSMAGVVEWNVPLSLLTQSGVDFKVRARILAKPDPSREPFLIGVALVILLMSLVIWYRRR